MPVKPILVGLHLAFAIIGIDAFLWLLGELAANVENARRRTFAALLGSASFIMSWLFGGYYYVVFYGPVVKPIIKAGAAPWAHAVVMEAKEHIFLFMIPMALTALVAARTNSTELRKPLMWLTGSLAMLGLSLGLMGYIISAAARWGAA
jgi:hypothetical protein